MAEVKWIKLDVSIPDNKKVKRIRKMPDGNNIILFWVFLLSRAGESNQKGGLFFTENVPYTEEDLAADFDFSIDFVRFAILTLEKYKMIELYDRIIFIKNWDEYQQMDKLEKIQEQNRVRQANYREKQKLIANNNVTLTLPVTENNAVDIELDIDLDLELEKESNKEITSKKDSMDTIFSEIWKLYPKKAMRKEALAAFTKAVKSGTNPDDIKEGVQKYVVYLEENKSWLEPMDGGRWFKKERWNDEYNLKAKVANPYEKDLGF